MTISGVALTPLAIKGQHLRKIEQEYYQIKWAMELEDIQAGFDKEAQLRAQKERINALAPRP